MVDPVRRPLTGRLIDTLEVLAGWPEGSVSPAQLSRWCWFHACSVRLQDRIRRRVLEGDTIPYEEKLFSLFEPHTRWIMKGKAGRPVELGVPLTVLEDQQFPLPVKRWSWRGFERLRLVLFRRLWWSGAMVYDSRLRPDHGGKDASTSDAQAIECFRTVGVKSAVF